MSTLGRLDGSLNLGYFSLICLPTYLMCFNMPECQNNTCFQACSVFLIGNMSALLFFFLFSWSCSSCFNQWFACGRSMELDSESQPSWHHFSLLVVSLHDESTVYIKLESSAWGLMARVAVPHLQNFFQKLSNMETSQGSGITKG